MPDRICMIIFLVYLTELFYTIANNIKSLKSADDNVTPTAVGGRLFRTQESNPGLI